MKKRVVSGIQPTGNLHLGNYLGAIRNWVKMQDEITAQGGDCFFFLADLHAITVHNDPRELATNVRQMAAGLIAAGIDPDRSVVFNQAAVPAHAELAWLLAGTARIGWLNRMTQFKDKAGKNREGASIGLFTYPVLMAADVLVYGATHVPVGEDQKQHLELARDIATKFNADFQTELFILPEPMIPREAARIMSLRDGNAKMSKSDPSEMSRIHLTDDADAIATKIRKAKTDPEPLPATMGELDGRPEARNLLSIYSALSEQSPEQILEQFSGMGFGAFKPALAEILIETLRPISRQLAELEANPDELDRILAVGASKARSSADPILADTYKTLGLTRATH